MSKPILALGAIAAAITAAWALLARIGPLLRKAAHFIDDVMGEPARPGQPARPSIFEVAAAALAAAEAAQEAALAAQRNTEPNDGGSIHDAIMRSFGEVSSQVSALTEQVHTLSLALAEQTRLHDAHRAESKDWLARTTALAAEAGFAVPPWRITDDPEEHT